MGSVYRILDFGFCFKHSWWLSTRLGRHYLEREHERNEVATEQAADLLVQRCAMGMSGKLVIEGKQSTLGQLLV